MSGLLPISAATPGLLPTNATLLQPVAGFFRLYHALWLMMLSSATAAPAIAQLSSDSADADIFLQNEITRLQTQIEDIHARLARGGIA